MAESGRIKLCAYSVGKEILSCNAVLWLVLFVLEDWANQAKILVYSLFVIQLSLSVNMAKESISVNLCSCPKDNWETGVSGEKQSETRRREGQE